MRKTAYRGISQCLFYRIPGDWQRLDVEKKRIHGQISLGNALFNFSTQCWQPVHEIFQWHGKQYFPVCWRQTPKASPGMAEASALQICSGTSGFLHSWWTHSTMGKEASISAAGPLLFWAHMPPVLNANMPLLSLNAPSKGHAETESLFWENLGVGCVGSKQI